MVLNITALLLCICFATCCFKPCCTLDQPTKRLIQQATVHGRRIHRMTNHIQLNNKTFSRIHLAVSIQSLAPLSMAQYTMLRVMPTISWFLENDRMTQGNTCKMITGKGKGMTRNMYTLDQRAGDLFTTQENESYDIGTEILSLQ